jgi:molybdopterin-guanine dinucleotide biosynthesis protein A
VLVAAVDLALLDASLVRELAGAPAGGAAAVVPRAGGRLQPLCARYEPAALGALEGFDPGARATDVVAALGPAVLELDDERPFSNVNGPEDLDRAAALLSRPDRRAP